MIIRQSTPREAPELVSLFTSAVHHLAATHYSENQRRAWAPEEPNFAQWEQRLASIRTLVAEINGRLAGFVGFGADGHIDLLHVAPGFERRGVASSLLREAEQILMKAGVSTFHTEASLVARAVFERAGYRVEAEEIVPLRGELFRRFRMTKDCTGTKDQAIKGDGPPLGSGISKSSG